MQHLAVASAFHKLREDRIIEITRVAGTSAGSLAAAILASGVDPELFAKNIEKHKGYYSKLMSRPGVLGSVLKSATGRSILRDSRLEAMFRHIWEGLEETEKLETFDDLANPNLMVVACDIANRCPKIYQSPEENIIEALVSSCAIPLLFRSIQNFKSKNFIVDGMLVENLPVSQLVKDSEEYGDVIAVSFEESNKKRKPENLLQYLNTIYNIYSEHNIKNLRSQLDSRHIFLIRSDIEPLDFDTAFNDYGVKQAEFSELRNDAIEWAQYNAQVFSDEPPGTDRLWVDTNPPAEKMMELVGTVYSRIFHHVSYRIPRRVIMVSAYSLLKKYRPADLRVNNPDEVTQLYSLAPGTEEPLNCFPLRLDWIGQTAPNAARRLTVTRAGDGPGINPILVPAKNLGERSDSSNVSETLLFFDPALSPGEIEDAAVEVKDFALVSGVMDDLATENRSFIGIRNHSQSTVEEAYLILGVPSECNHIQIAWRTNEDETYVSGEEISEDELAQYSAHFPGDFRAMGWRATNIGPGKRFTGDIHITDRTVD